MDKEPTPKQLAYIDRIIAHLGREKTMQSLDHYFPGVTFDNMTRAQAQKLITGTDSQMPKHVISRVSSPWHYHQ